MKKIIASLALVFAIAASAYFVAGQAGSSEVSAVACNGTSHCE